jgi:hypothetical protein
MAADDLLTLPDGAAALLLSRGGLQQASLLETTKFVKFARERGSTVTMERLLAFEKKGLFSPIVRLFDPGDDVPPMRWPMKDSIWFDRGWAQDATKGTHRKPSTTRDETTIAFYSRFQIASLAFVESEFTMHVNLEDYLDATESPFESRGGLEAVLRRSLTLRMEGRGDRFFRPAVDLLCQFISDRYLPHARSNRRSRKIRYRGCSGNRFMILSHGHAKSWEQFAREYRPEDVAEIFALTPAKLRHAYEALALQLTSSDPIAKWSPLVQFVAVEKRDELKGKALAADTMRNAATMLNCLYKDLYGTALPAEDEIYTHVMTHMPELTEREDTRRHMEFVLNAFDLNSRPKLTLFVEGESERIIISALFQRYIGVHPGTAGVEIVNLGGVDNATGTKDDRFRAILRLIDYLHHHQTMTFLILDNERFARKLQAEAAGHASVMRSTRTSTRADHIHVWSASLEFDNFDDDEIAQALRSISSTGAMFAAEEVGECRRAAEPGAALSALFRGKDSSKLPKGKLANALVEAIFDDASSVPPGERVIVKIVQRVVELATRNPFPTMQETWQRNQNSGYLGVVKGK